MTLVESRGYYIPHIYLLEVVPIVEFPEILTAISTVGFPIVACIVLAVILYKQNEAHKQEMNEVKEAINNNTIALTKLTDKIEFTEVYKK